ncbi:MAG: HdeD family acid-resistance protein [Paludibacteraceae bacterium]
MANLLKSYTNSVRHWYIPLILGILFVVFGIYLFTVPLATYAMLSILFSASFFVSGIFDIFFSIKNSKILNGWGWYLVGGIISFIMGIYLMIYPQISMVVLPFVVGFTVMFRSFQLLGTALDLKDAGVLRWGNLAVSSVLGIILSFMLIANPLFSGVSIVVLTALSFVFVGIASSVLAFDLKKVKDYPDKIGDDLKNKFNDLQNEIEKTLK